MISYLLVFIKKYIPGSNVYFVLLLYVHYRPKPQKTLIFRDKTSRYANLIELLQNYQWICQKFILTIFNLYPKDLLVYVTNSIMTQKACL